MNIVKSIAAVMNVIRATYSAKCAIVKNKTLLLYYLF